MKIRKKKNLHILKIFYMLILRLFLIKPLLLPLHWRLPTNFRCAAPKLLCKPHNYYYDDEVRQRMNRRAQKYHPQYHWNDQSHPKLSLRYLFFKKKINKKNRNYIFSIDYPFLFSNSINKFGGAFGARFLTAALEPEAASNTLKRLFNFFCF